MVTSDALLGALERGIAKGRRTLVSVTAAVEIADPCATIFASRLASDRWFCWEQPDRDFALAGMGVAREASGARRAALRGGRRGRAGETGRDAIVDEPRGVPAGAGPVWLGGFAFDPEGGGSATWSSFEPGSLFLPEVSICRSGGDAFLTVNAIVGPGDDAERRGAELGARLAGLRADATLPLLDPHPTARPRSAAPSRRAPSKTRSRRRQPGSRRGRCRRSCSPAR